MEVTAKNGVFYIEEPGAEHWDKSTQVLKIHPKLISISEIDIQELGDIQELVSSLEWGESAAVSSVSQTTNTEILNLEKFSSVNQQIKKALDIYFYDILHASRNIKIYTTESWLNKEEKGQHHHSHIHTNSIISGVLYLTSHSGRGGQSIFHESSLQLTWDRTEDFNVYIQPRAGKLILFESHLRHSVNLYENPKEEIMPSRVTLAFNTFFSGKICDSSRLAKLHL